MKCFWNILFWVEIIIREGKWWPSGSILTRVNAHFFCGGGGLADETNVLRVILGSLAVFTGDDLDISDLTQCCAALKVRLEGCSDFLQFFFFLNRANAEVKRWCLQISTSFQLTVNYHCSAQQCCESRHHQLEQIDLKPTKLISHKLLISHLVARATFLSCQVPLSHLIAMQSCQGSKIYWQQVPTCKISVLWRKKCKLGFFLISWQPVVLWLGW